MSKGSVRRPQQVPDETVANSWETIFGRAKSALPKDRSCSTHPNAPHGFDRSASHNAGEYVCTCESWKPTTNS